MESKTLFLTTLILILFCYFNPVYSQIDEKLVEQSYYKENANSPDDLEYTNNGEELQDKMDISISYLPGMLIGGAGMHLGSEVIVFEEVSEVSEGQLPGDVFEDSRRDYGDKITPIVTQPTSELPFMLDLGYTLNDTRIGLSFFRLAGSYNETGEVPGYYQQSRQNSESFGYGFVNFWNMGWDLHASRNFPAVWVEGIVNLDHYEDEENAEYSLTFYPEKGNTVWSASHETSLNSFQLTFQHPLINTETLDLNMIGGLHYGRWKDELHQLANITAHIEMTDIWTDMVWDSGAEDSIKVEFHLRNEFHNDITLETKSSVEYNPLGLMVGFDAGWSITPSIKFSFNAGISSLRGEASLSGKGIDVDDIVNEVELDLYDMDGNWIYNEVIQGFEYLSGEFELPETSSSLTSANYRLNMSVSYMITEMISLNAGYFYSLWRGLPMSPQWSYPDN